MGVSRKRLRIGGMSCVHCQEKIESALRETAGVHKAEVSYRSGIAEIIYDPDMVAPEELQTVIERLDYTVMPETAGPAPALALPSSGPLCRPMGERSPWKAGRGVAANSPLCCRKETKRRQNSHTENRSREHLRGRCPAGAFCLLFAGCLFLGKSR